MEQITLQVKSREGSGKSETRKLRQAGLVPGIVYGKEFDPVSIALDEKSWRMATHEGVRIGRLVELAWEGKKKVSHVALVREVQLHPVTDKPLHIDFQVVKAGEEIELEVRLAVIGTPVGVKDEGGNLDIHLRQIRIKCLPGKIPDEIPLDISGLHAGDTLHVNQVMWNDGEILTDGSLAVVSVEHPAAEAVAEVEEEEEAAPIEEEPSE